MSSIAHHIAQIRQHIPQNVQLVCVSKFQPVESIKEAYQVGERDFGESRVQELVEKHQRLEKDIRWHMIGHLQTNKVKAIVPFVYLIQSVDSEHLLQTIEQESAKISRTTDVLLEVHVAQENSKSGFSVEKVVQILTEDYHAKWPHVRIRGIMGMATQTSDEKEIRRCFQQLHQLSHLVVSDQPNPICSYGMSSDFKLAIQEGANMIRIGTDIFGERK